MGFRLSWVTSHPCAAALEETTSIVPKRFTYGPVPFWAKSFDTVQIFSVTIKEIKPELGFRWPLQVYGLVAARDNSDLRLRNIVLSRDRNHCQMLTAGLVCQINSTTPLIIDLLTNFLAMLL
ncbi:hypothetical protein BAE44_0014055 [Dichanthelium oligosanthes]|uniref:DUF6598 domain-containing protein n=1 Tax=Dichanthelium oligosanthes TaxID=888268 RepID=A0A1E5VIJ1_9POAL|nr:hypothetical protein BAE44_0014055 [Dichanthelium oligosanthes]